LDIRMHLIYKSQIVDSLSHVSFCSDPGNIIIS